MVLSIEGRKRLSDFARKRERSRSGRFLPTGAKYVYDMSYIRRGSSRKSGPKEKWVHVRVTQYSRVPEKMGHFRRVSDMSKPPDAIIPRGSRTKFEAFEDLRYTKKQATREGLEDQEAHIEKYTGRGGGLADT